MKIETTSKANPPCVNSTVKTEELKKENMVKTNSPKYLAGSFKLFKTIKNDDTIKIFKRTPQVPKFIYPSEMRPLLADISGLLK
jgi:hypothetical protein|tara:strand:- start:2927 stop:3178 length:252 start_codon:yes stop_codon:yes gene_type:complete